MKEMFNAILDKDENIIEVLKPQKAKFMFSACIQFVFTCWFILLITGIIIFSNVPLEWWIILTILFGTFALCTIIFVCIINVYYKNLYFAYSNKRIIIRSGIIGVDYKSLDMAMIGAANVYVSFIDKIVKRNTGSISFGSTASPIVGINNYLGYYKFSNIVNPYETYKVIKNAIDQFKNSAQKETVKEKTKTSSKNNNKKTV